MQAQLLTIIEDQQNKLDDALKIIQKQNRTIEQLDSFNNELLENRTTLIDYQKKLTQALNNIQSADLSATVLSPLKMALDNHLKHLIDSLDIKSLVSTEIESLIEMQLKAFKQQLSIQQQNTQLQVKQAVEQEVKPMKQQLMSELQAVQKYQQHLQDLIQQISAKL